MEGGLVVEKEQIRSILTYSALVDRLKGAFGNAANYSAPDRHHHDIDGAAGGTLLLMPAWTQQPSRGSQPPQATRAAFIGVKIVSLFPKNSERGLASVLGVYLLSCGETGQPLALIDGTELTLWRTACVSALAATYLARPDARVLLMVGAGALAPHLIQAHLAVTPSIDTVIVWNRTHERARSLADSLKRSTAVFESRSVLASADLEQSIRRADVVLCATMSEDPLVRRQWLKPGVHLSLVGAYRPSMRECDDETVEVSRVYVDDIAGAVAAGDLHGPISRGVISKAHVVGDLADLVASRVSGRQGAVDITLFKSVGFALQDLAAAQFIYELASSSSSAVSRERRP